MNVQTPITAVGYQDFLLVEAPRDDVVAAIARDLDDTGMPWAETVSWETPPLYRFLARIFGYGAAMDRTEAMMRAAEEGALLPPEEHPFTLHDGADSGKPLSRIAPPAHDFAPGVSAYSGEGWDDVRVSTVAGQPGLTLVEMQEICAGFSPRGFGLSCQLPGVDVLYFRRSGPGAAEAHHDFHLYNSGDTLRRVLCHATWPEGDPSREQWDATAEGPMSAYEPADLYPPIASSATLLDAARIDRILAGFGVTADSLLAPEGRTDAVLLSRKPGGQSLPS